MTANKKERLTSQKKIILDYLRRVKTHPSAEEIFQAVKKKLPRISLGTVYRILKNLKEKGEIFEIMTDISHFNGDVSSHSHFICQRCKRIFDVGSECQKCQIIKNKKLKKGEIKNFQIYFYGLCQKCKK